MWKELSKTWKGLLKSFKVFLVLILLLKGDVSFSQWQVMNSGITANLVDGCFVSDSIGFVISDNGVVLKTMDQGNSWAIVAGLSGVFTSISHVGLDTIYAGGNSIYRSNDGGISWNNIISLPNVMTDLEFFNAQKGVYIKPATDTCFSSQGNKSLDNYEAYTTVDGGISWQFSFDLLLPFSRFQLLNDSSAYVTGGNYYIFNHCNGEYYNLGWKTNDFGTSWLNAPPPGVSYSVFSLINDTSGYFAGIDHPTYTNVLWRMTGPAFNIVRQMQISVNQLVFINEIDGYLLSTDTIYKTSTEGIVWDLDSTPVYLLNKILNDNKKELFAIGANGTILKKEIIESLYPDSVYRISTSVSSLNFDSVMVGANKVIPITITNEGNMDLNVSVNASGVFQLSLSDSNYSSAVSFPLMSLHDTVIYIIFIPQDTLIYSDSLIIMATNTADQKIELVGQGINELVGYISGVLNFCQDTVRVVGDVIVNNSGKVIICPGTTILFMGPYKFEVRGTLIASGTQADSIRFTPQDTAVGWQGIQFKDTIALDTSIIRHCIIEYGKKLLWPNTRGGGLYFVWHSNVIVDSSSISNNYVDGLGGYGGGINIENASPAIKNNKINNNLASTGGGIYITGAYSSPLILNNEIYENKTIHYDGGGIHCHHTYAPTHPRIIQNLIFNNTSVRFGGGISCTISSCPDIINNTICNNYGASGGGGLYISGNGNSYPVTLNNIFFFNFVDQILDNSWNQIDANYCNIEGGYNNGTGIVDLNPSFVNPTDSNGFMDQIGNYDWSLVQNSHCIDAGDTSFNPLIPAFDFAGNPRIYMNGRIDIGAYEYQGVFNLINETIIAEQAGVLPNPFTHTLNVSVKSNYPVEFIVYDIYSRIVLQKTITNISKINTEQFANGVYVYEVRNKTGEIIKKGKVIKQ